MLTIERACAAPASVVWPYLAQPALWHAWAPHLRGASGLGHPEVEVGARGAARLFGAVAVPARITAKEPGRSWTWRVGPMTLVHRVEPAAGGGSAIAIDLAAPALVEPALAVTYGPVIGLLLRNLARVAARPR